ncbi:MAG: hypothetical protein ABH865_05660 [Candidatus Omnitrophota bacterium]
MIGQNIQKVIRTIHAGARKAAGNFGMPDATATRVGRSLRSARVLLSLVLTFLLIIAGLLFFVPEARAYQIKRVVRGNTTLDLTIFGINKVEGAFGGS